MIKTKQRPELKTHRADQRLSKLIRYYEKQLENPDIGVSQESAKHLKEILATENARKDLAEDRALRRAELQREELAKKALIESLKSQAV